MSAVDNLESDADVVGDDEEEPGLWTSFGAALRLIVGWFCVAIGVLNLVVEVDRRPGAADGGYLLFHGTVLLGGAVLLALGAIAPRPGVVGYTAGAAVLVLGTLVSALPDYGAECCLSSFAVRHGFPFTLAAHDVGGRWHIDSQHVLADLMFWGYLGLIVLVLISLLRRGPARPESDDEGAAQVP